MSSRATEPGPGPLLIAEAERWQIFDDELNGRAIVTVANGQGKRTELTNVEIPRPSTKLGWKILEYVAEACHGRVGLVDFVLRNRCSMKHAEYLHRYRSKSLKSMKSYADQVRRLCDYCKRTPDELVNACLDGEGVPNAREIHRLSALVKQYLGEFEAEDRARDTLGVYQARIVSFFKVNGIVLDPLVPYPSEPDNPGRAPTQEELKRMIEVADLMMKAIIAALATSGMREGTLRELRYGHVKEDLEARRFPIHIRLEGAILKGHYVPACDTFITEEAAHYLILYLEARRRGTEKIPPEIITDESHLFVVPHVDQAERTLTTRPLSEGRLWELMRRAFTRAGLTSKTGSTYDLRPHCLRKFFRTQMGALGVNPDYIEYMMGHKLSTYNDVASKGVEFLRAEYAKADLRIQELKSANVNDILAEMIKQRGKPWTTILETGIAGPDGHLREVLTRTVYNMILSDIRLGQRDFEFTLSPGPDKSIISKPPLQAGALGPKGAKPELSELVKDLEDIEERPRPDFHGERPILSKRVKEQDVGARAARIRPRPLKPHPRDEDEEPEPKGRIGRAPGRVGR